MNAYIRHFTFVVLLVVAAAYCKEGGNVGQVFKVPDEAINIKTNDSGKTWRMTGELPLSVSEAEKRLRQKIETEGFIFLHEIPMRQDKVKKLLAWKKDNARLILFIWEIDERKTGFSWGISQE